MARDRDAELLVLQVRANGSAHDAADPKKSADPDRYLAHMPERFPQLRVRSWSEAGDPADRGMTNTRSVLGAGRPKPPRQGAIATAAPARAGIIPPLRV